MTEFKIKRQYDTRKFTEFKIHKDEHQRLQFQWEDENLNCIGKSPVLKYKNIYDLEWIPNLKNDHIELKKPKNAKYILIWGYQPEYASNDDFLISVKDNKFDKKYESTIGIKIYDPVYLTKPLRKVRALFDLTTGFRLIKYSMNDIVDSINIQNDTFISVKLSEKFHKINSNKSFI